MARAFEREGYQTVNWSYPSKEGTIGEHALYLNLKLQEIAHERPGEKIHFVTHSLGGIVLRTAINLPTCPEEARNGGAVLLAPPNRGSQFAHFLNKYQWVHEIFGRHAGRELLTKQNFNEVGEFPDSMRVMVVGGTAGINPWVAGDNDGKVAFEETCLKTPHTHIKTWAGHSWMMWDKRVIKRSIDFLRG
ncbi:MAG: hypothetical protein K940chlam2_00576 [Chlamydiae bacterium]|nr:hypothetical protein [Chlamydiota bacterium]